MTPIIYDVFISQANEDQNAFSDELVLDLKKKGLSVWFCNLELDPAMSLKDIIVHALTESRYVVFIISPAFLQRKWSVLQLEMIFAERSWRLLVLPLANAVSANELVKDLPLLSGRLISFAEDDISSISDRVVKVVRKIKSAAEKAGKQHAEKKGNSKKDSSASGGVLLPDGEKL